MRVLHVIPSLSQVHGGPTRALTLMEQALTELGVTVETVSTDDDGAGRRNGKPCEVPLQENGVTRRYFCKRLDFYKVAPGMALWLARHARDYDLLHIHALFSFSTIAAAWAAHRAGVPYVLRPLGTLTRYGVTQRRPWLKRLSLACLEGPALRRAAAVHFTSEDEMREAAECGVPMKGVVIPLGVEEPLPSDDALVRTHFAALGDAPYLLFLSRLDPKKNVEGLLRALRELLDCHGLRPRNDEADVIAPYEAAVIANEVKQSMRPGYMDCRASLAVTGSGSRSANSAVPGHGARDDNAGVKLLIAGDGSPEYVASLKAFASELGLADRVVWAGHIDGALKASALAGAELFVLPSFSENFGIAAAEALMAGLPCVLGQGVAISQDVVKAGAGLAVLPDAASIAAGLLQVMADSETRSQMSKAAVQLARQHYSAQAMGQNLLRLYESLV